MSANDRINRCTDLVLQEYRAPAPLQQNRQHWNKDAKENQALTWTQAHYQCTSGNEMVKMDELDSIGLL
jgi:hypothetical protein